MTTNTKWVLGLVAAILVAVAGQPDAVPEPLRHWLGLGGLIGTAISGYMIRRPDDRRQDNEPHQQERRDGDQ